MALNEKSGNPLVSRLELIEQNYLPLAGGTITGGLGLNNSLTFNKVYNAIRYIGTSSTNSMIRFLDNADNEYGTGVSIGGGGATIIGGGESALTMEGALASNDQESLFLCNDGNIDFYTNCQNGTDSAVHTWIDTIGKIHAKNFIITDSAPSNSVLLGNYLNGYDSNPYGGFYVCHYNSAKYVGIQNGTYTQYEITKSASSSRKVKENISLMTDEQANNLLNLSVINFDYKPDIENGKKNQKGIIIEELIDTMPECIVNLDDYNGDNSEILQVDYTKFVPYLIKMIQIQQKEIDALKKEW